MIPALAERAFRLLAAAPVEGCIAEFGVYRGESLARMAEYARAKLGHLPPLYGFDTFAGMPETRVPLERDFARMWAEGTFSDTSLAEVRARVPEATLVPGRFQDLRQLSEYGVGRVMLAHVDADIYEGYRDALRLLTPHLQVGTVMLFDESVPPTDSESQSVREHGQRAIREWEAETGFNLHLVRFTWTVSVSVIVDEDYLLRNWRVIDDLRNDTIRESAWNVARKLRGRPREVRPGYARR